MSPGQFWVRPTMIPVEPAFEYIDQSGEPCPFCGEVTPVQPIGLPHWLRLPRLRRMKGLATGIIGLW